MPIRGMLLTVGVGSSVHHGLSESLRAANPDVVALLVTSASRQKTLPRLSDALEDARTHCFPVADPDDVHRCLGVVREALAWLQEQGCRRRDVTVDFTSGTKAMSAAAVYGAIDREVGRLSYVSGARNKNGIVQTGHERYTSFATVEFLLEREMNRLLRLADDCRFRPARRECDRLLEGPLAGEWKQRLELLRGWCEALDAWDCFRWSDALRGLKELRRSPACGGEMQRPLTRWIEHMEALNDDGEGREARMAAELYLNAGRRARAGRYDDALARLYRLLEFLAQAMLCREGLALWTGGTVKLQTERVGEAVSERLRDRYGKAFEQGRLGLRGEWELLAEHDPDRYSGVLARLKKGGDLCGLLHQRNFSILAHGFQSVQREHWEKAEGLLRELAAGFFTDFERLCEECALPRPGDYRDALNLPA